MDVSGAPAGRGGVENSFSTCAVEFVFFSSIIFLEIFLLNRTSDALTSHHMESGRSTIAKSPPPLACDVPLSRPAVPPFDFSKKIFFLPIGGSHGVPVANSLHDSMERRLTGRCFQSRITPNCIICTCGEEICPTSTHLTQRNHEGMQPPQKGGGEARVSELKSRVCR